MGVCVCVCVLRLKECNDLVFCFDVGFEQVWSPNSDPCRHALQCPRVGMRMLIGNRLQSVRISLRLNRSCELEASHQDPN